mmetsp:Transcript_39636/g.55212  ORF Transcript_39636/g.55212 Transcript_39636/m.55212 type:complete len:90 (+) Transcript_39636:75-344(+)
MSREHAEEMKRAVISETLASPALLNQSALQDGLTTPKEQLLLMMELSQIPQERLVSHLEEHFSHHLTSSSSSSSGLSTDDADVELDVEK